MLWRYSIHLVVALIISSLGLLLTGCGNGEEDEVIAAPEATATPAPTPTLEEHRSRVVRELRTLSDLQTATHSVETVVEVEGEGGFLASDRLLLVAIGQVRAGVDFMPLTEANVELVPNQAIRVTLPESEVFELIIDEEETEVLSRESGLLASEDESLEVEAREIAEEQIMQSACNHDILERAASEAEVRIALLLTSLGYEEVNVIAQAGTC